MISYFVLPLVHFPFFEAGRQGADGSPLAQRPPTESQLLRGRDEQLFERAGNCARGQSCSGPVDGPGGGAGRKLHRFCCCRYGCCERGAKVALQSLEPRRPFLPRERGVQSKAARVRTEGVGETKGRGGRPDDRWHPRMIRGGQGKARSGDRRRFIMEKVQWYLYCYTSYMYSTPFVHLRPSQWIYERGRSGTAIPV